MLYWRKMYFVTQFEMKDIHVMGYDSIPGTTLGAAAAALSCNSSIIVIGPIIAVGVIDTVEN